MNTINVCREKNSKIMKLKTLLFCLLLVCSLSGCDWVKAKLGMATSEDIRRMKLELEEKTAMEQRMRDSLEKMRLDSLQAVRALQTDGQRLDKRFYVIVGSYILKSNADNMYAHIEKLGLKPSRIKTKNGYEMIASGGGFETLPQACAYWNELYYRDDFSADIWIYDALEGLHSEENPK